MARKKATPAEPAAAAAGQRVPALLGADPEALDTEERRRLRNQRRRYVRRQVFRRGRLDVVAEKDPAYHEELLRLRRDSPQAFRKALIRWCLDHGEYPDRLYTSREQPASLMERYSDVAGGDDED